MFQKVASDISKVVFDTGLTNVADIEKQILPSGLSVDDSLKEVIAKLGEEYSPSQKFVVWNLLHRVVFCVPINIILLGQI